MNEKEGKEEMNGVQEKWRKRNGKREKKVEEKDRRQ